MNNTARLIYGLLITIVVFTISNLAGSKLQMDIDFIPSSFSIHSVMLILSIALILSLKAQVGYKIAFPTLKKTLKPILLGLLAAIVVNITMALIVKITGGETGAHPALVKMSALQVFVFVLIYASIAEELLFRGFLMNILKPLKEKGIKILKLKLSAPVLISAIAFGLAHLILITTGASATFLLRIVLFTTILGTIAGYYQEKYDNNAYAIIVHMAGNIIGVVGVLAMNAMA
jgi:membrane protease YdiL (CAAX protease family)